MDKITLYQKNTGGKVKVWSISVVDRTEHSIKIVEHGQLGGKIQATETLVLEGKNIGKANFTTHYTQAVADANSEINKKLKKGYVYELDNVKESTELGSGIVAPMLAKTFDPTGKIDKSKDLYKLKLYNTLIGAQFKLDGHRCLIEVIFSVEDLQVQLYTRTGDKMYNFPHIVSAVKNKRKELEILREQFNTDKIVLDGEIYAHGFCVFDKLSGLIRKQKREEEHYEAEKNLKFFIYDIVSDKHYQDRFQLIQNLVDGIDIVLTPTYFMIATDENLYAALEFALQSGYEGLIIRDLNKGYEHKRTWQLLKYKLWQDDEFEIIGFNKEIGNDTLGSIKFKIKEGVECDAPFKGTDEEQKEIWTNQANYLGKYGTVEFFGYTESGSLRFPKCVKFRKGKSLD